MSWSYPVGPPGYISKKRFSRNPTTQNTVHKLRNISKLKFNDISFPLIQLSLKQARKILKQLTAETN